MTGTSPTWVKSRRCESNACVEAASDGDEVLVRDGKKGQDSPVHRFNSAAWVAFIGAVRDGDFDFGLFEENGRR